MRDIHVHDMWSKLKCSHCLDALAIAMVPSDVKGRIAYIPVCSTCQSLVKRYTTKAPDLLLLSNRGTWDASEYYLEDDNGN